MIELRNLNFIRTILSKAPLILLFVSVLNDYDFNYLSLKYFSFNFPIGIPALSKPLVPEV